MQSVVKQKARTAFPEEYANPFSAAYWREAAAQLTDIRIICIAAILIAVRVALKEVKIPIGENLNVTVGFFVNALGAMIFGPVVAVVAAAVSDHARLRADRLRRLFLPVHLRRDRRLAGIRALSLAHEADRDADNPVALLRVARLQFHHEPDNHELVLRMDKQRQIL